MADNYGLAGWSQGKPVTMEHSEVEVAFLDDRLTICFAKQKAALQLLRQHYGKDYGKPAKDTASEKRGKKYLKCVNEEVVDLCSLISIQGKKNQNGTSWISFGELFRFYQFISNKVVGILHRARKNRLVHFDGETLWQGKDNLATITLLVAFQCIQAHFIKTGRLLRNTGANYIVVRDGCRTNLIKLNYGTESPLYFEACGPLGDCPTLLETAVVTTHPTHNTATAQHQTVKINSEKKPEVRKKQRPLSRIVLDFGSSSLVSSGLS